MDQVKVADLGKAVKPVLNIRGVFHESQQRERYKRQYLQMWQLVGTLEEIQRSISSSLLLRETCTKKPDVGAHVQKDSSTDKGWYIVPLCTEHNLLTGKSLDLIEGAPLVSANVSQTCG